jgi:uncharacterized protein (TIGR02217 family)
VPISSFHDILFPEDISYGSSGGPGFNTTVIELTSGHEQRNINWSEVKATYDVSHGVKTRPQMQELLDFFYARWGKAYGFRFKDWMDFQLVEEVIAIGDGATKIFQVIKVYEPNGFPYSRPIRKLNPGTITVHVNSTLQTQPGQVSVDNSTGLITFVAAPAAGTNIIVDGEFHVPVRFDTDDIKITHDDWELMSWPNIPLVELKPRSSDGTII